MRPLLFSKTVRCYDLSLLAGIVLYPLLHTVYLVLTGRTFQLSFTQTLQIVPLYQSEVEILQVQSVTVFEVLTIMFQYCTELIHSLDQQVVTRIREIDLSCYSLIVPVLQEVADKCIPGKKLVRLSGSSRRPSLCVVHVWH